MAATDAVTSTAIARREVRRSLDRLEYHLSRGPRGVRGVEREVRFLDALHRRSVAQAGRAVGASYTSTPIDSFGRKAAAALSTGSASTVGRMKSSVLADFAVDSLQPARDFALRADVWVWTANASACPTCLNRHGQTYSGGQLFTPAHPSCLCIPQPVGTPGLRPLSDGELVEAYESYGDPRYRAQVERFKRGEISRNQLGRVEAVNDSARGRAAVLDHARKLEVRQNALGAGAAPDAVEDLVVGATDDFMPIDARPTDIADRLYDLGDELDTSLYSEWHSATGGGDGYLAQLFETRGYHAKPTVLADDAFDAIPTESLFRGVDHKSYVDDFIEGRYHRPGDGIFGNGTYTANASGAVQIPSIPDSFRSGLEVAKSYTNGSPSGAVFEMKLKPGARVVEYDDLKAKVESMEAILYAAPREVRAIADDYGRLATALGYDAIHVSGGANYTVILNRGATYVRSRS